MSGGPACRDPFHRQNSWRVVQRKSNQSAFNGYRYTASDYSAVKCGICGIIWRTKAKYVDRLRDETVTA